MWWTQEGVVGESGGGGDECEGSGVLFKVCPESSADVHFGDLSISIYTL